MKFHDQGKKTVPVNFEEVEMLASEVADFTCSRTSHGFYCKAILALGPGIVREAMGEVRMRQAQGGLIDPARYLTTVLRNWMDERVLTQDTPVETERVLTQDTFSIVEIKPDTTKAPENDEIRTLDFPFAPDLIQWLLFVGPEYFTLTNEKARFDLIANTKIEFKGKIYEVPMLRGKLGRNDDERGILTSEHMRVLGAVERIWADNKGPHSVNGGRCVVNAPVSQIARYMGIGTSGREYDRISRKIRDLGATGYCYLLKENPELREKGLDDLSFQFFGETQSITTTNDGKRMTYFQIVFSKAYSAALLSRSKVVVSRPLELLQKRGDIALKLVVYLFPKLKKHGEHSIELLELVDKIALKRMGWQIYKSLRKREFEKAVRELNGMPSGDGRVFSLQIVQGLNKADFLLSASLISP